MIKVALFDNNGTLEDDLNLAYGSVVQICKTYGVSPPSLEQYRNEVGKNYMDFYYNHGIPREVSADELNKIRKEYYEENSNEAGFRPDAIEVIEELGWMGIKTGIVSAEVESILIPKLHRAGFVPLVKEEYIRAGIYGSKVPALLDMCAKMGVKPQEAIYVDDMADGCIAAEKAGLFPVGFGSGYNSPERLKEVSVYIIYELSQIFHLLNLLRRA